MRHGVEKRILPFIASNLANQKDSIENNARNENGKKNDAENREGHSPLIQKNPANIEGNKNTDKQAAERDEECNGPAASSNVHWSG